MNVLVKDHEPGRVYCHEGYAEGTGCPLRFAWNGFTRCRHLDETEMPDCILIGPAGASRTALQILGKLAILEAKLKGVIDGD